MRITIITGPFFALPPAPCGAVERIWWDLGREFARRGHSVTMVSRGIAGAPSAETIEGVRVLRGPEPVGTASLLRNLMKDLIYSARVSRVVPPGDIVVTNGFWLPPALRVFASSPGRVVANIQRAPKGQIGLYLRSRVSRLAAVSTAIADQIAAERPDARSITRVIPNPIDTSAFGLGEPHRSVAGPPMILYTGRIAEEKGLDLLVRAYCKLRRERPTLRLELVGPWKIESGGGGEEYRARLRAIAADAPVEFVEPIYDRAALAAKLRSATVYCYPSVAEQGEAFGVAPLESMAVGVAPVVSSLAVFREFLEPGINGLVFDHRAPDAVDQLASRLDELLSDEERRKRLGEAGAARAAGFGIPRVADQYLEDFQSLLSR